jgi:hypothetical protein
VSGKERVKFKINSQVIFIRLVIIIEVIRDYLIWRRKQEKMKAFNG